MDNVKTKITNEELRAKLKESYLEQSQKDELQALIPDMSEEDRNQLLSLIAQSHEVKAQEDKGNAEMQPALKELNAKYDQKMNQLVRTLSSKVRTDYEELGKSSEKEELQALETELKQI